MSLEHFPQKKEKVISNGIKDLKSDTEEGTIPFIVHRIKHIYKCEIKKIKGI